MLGEGVPLLQEKQKWMRPRSCFAVGDIVVIMDPVDSKRFLCDGKNHSDVLRDLTRTGQLDRLVSKMEAEVP